MKLLATGGGTGGHVYPALSIIEALVTRAPEPSAVQVAWVGASESIEERITTQHEMTFFAINTGALRGANPLQAVVSVAKLLQGFWQAGRIVRDQKPDVVLATGGYVSVPLVLAAAWRGCPSLIYLPDMEPGLAVKFLSRFARRIAVSVPSAASFFADEKVVVSGYPVRRALFSFCRAEARAVLGLSDEVPVVLIIGGSRGARSINEAILARLDDLLAQAQIVHVCGRLDYDRLEAHRQELSREARLRYHLHAYLDAEMPAALAAADLTITRSGASVLGELPAVGSPSILVPYPYAGRHQEANAKYLADHGAAMILQDATLMETLYETTSHLLADKEALQQMRLAAQALARPQAAATIAQELMRLTKKGQDG